jgi:hypothetical protein
MAFPKLQRLRTAYDEAEARALHLARSLLEKLWSRGDVQFIAYVSLLVGSMLILRPLFSYWVPRATYGQSFIAWQMVLDDWAAVQRANHALRPAAPTFLFLLFPTPPLTQGAADLGTLRRIPRAAVGDHGDRRMFRVGWHHL